MKATDDLDAALLGTLREYVARAPLFAELRARGTADDLVQDALLVVRDRGDVKDPFAYATRVAQNLARRAYLREEPEVALEEAGASPTVDVAELAELRAELEEGLGAVRATALLVEGLPVTDAALVCAELLRHDQRALARRLGISRATLYRRKQAVLEGFVQAVAERARAKPCPERIAALLAAAGGSGFASARQAREHARTCAPCAATLRLLAAARHALLQR